MVESAESVGAGARCEFWAGDARDGAGRSIIQHMKPCYAVSWSGGFSRIVCQCQPNTCTCSALAGAGVRLRSEEGHCVSRDMKMGKTDVSAVS